MQPLATGCTPLPPSRHKPKLTAVVGHQHGLGGIQMNPAKSINSIIKEHSHAHC
jgi:hypothetical protein